MAASDLRARRSGVSHLLHCHQENNPRPQETHGDLPEGQWAIQLSIRLGAGWVCAVTTCIRDFCVTRKKCFPVRLFNTIPRQTPPYELTFTEFASGGARLLKS